MDTFIPSHGIIPSYRPALLSSDYTAFDSPGGRLDCLGLFTAVTKYKGRRYKFNVVVKLEVRIRIK